MGFFDVVNVYGLLFAAVLLVPHIVYMKTHTLDTGVFANRAMVYIDRVGRLASLFLMSFHIGVLELGFTEPQALMRRFWLITMGVCSVLYALLWLLFFKKETKGCALGIILISSFMVMFSGILQVNTLLLTAGIVYLIGELYLFSRYFRK
ncbi:MAG: hypothetical protein II614_00095 [Ruminococcus sp.]|nr:hypothetical protein [Ruminococcus sp.]MBQ2469685.1 hypothetical protein [Ruminococcus sp.]MBQ4169986.1 hypothetical protein [Ruminococcus sp.]